jgi:tetratricopeptide (TPR) repeat protein
VDRALVLNPNLAGAWYASGWVRVHRGEPEIAIEHFARAMRLSLFDPQMIAMQAGTSFAHFLAGRYDQASSWTEKAMWAQANYLTSIRIAAASKALAGKHTEAQRPWLVCMNSILRCALPMSGMAGNPSLRSPLTTRLPSGVC